MTRRKRIKENRHKEKGVWGLVLIPALTVATATAGSYFTAPGLSGWYQGLNLPSWTPPGAVIGLVWTILYVLSAAAAILVYKTDGRVKSKTRIWLVFLANAILNAGWSFIFFQEHLILAAFWEAVMLGLSVLLLIWLIRPLSKIAAWLLWPYALWVGFAAFLTLNVWWLNS